MAIKGMHHVAVGIPAGAENEARRFYRDLLGLDEIPKPDSLAGRGGLWLQTPDGLQIHLQIDEPDAGRSRRHFGLVVDGGSSIKTRMKKAGYWSRDDVDIPGFSRFFVNDPWGNQIELLSPKVETR
ncbi:MAG: glyoxalase [Candidatus Binatia bacterium]